MWCLWHQRQLCHALGVFFNLHLWTLCARWDCVLDPMAADHCSLSTSSHTYLHFQLPQCYLIKQPTLFAGLNRKWKGSKDNCWRYLLSFPLMHVPVHNGIGGQHGVKYRKQEQSIPNVQRCSRNYFRNVYSCVAFTIFSALLMDSTRMLYLILTFLSLPDATHTLAMFVVWTLCLEAFRCLNSPFINFSRSSRVSMYSSSNWK